jgi:glyceraldehyde 3-phosphate dehydrogenase
LIILVVNFQEEPSGERIGREQINAIYRQAAEVDPDGYLLFTERQNVSSDIVGMPRAAVIVEGHETHSRTAEAQLDLANVPGIPAKVLAAFRDLEIRIPVTQSVIYGWYDNEMGSYVNMLGDRTVSIADTLL